MMKEHGGANHIIGFVIGVLLAHNVCTALWRQTPVPVCNRQCSEMLMPKGDGDL